ncbi:hypothetical protein IWQ57_006946 [Coemansia nantahalensis]|uniref:Uncharacterized protein n=2 Tax=Coemansia TaxID=4863 RepID=A0ACC1JID2_9FUNG|nr:hypothetical protein IWQ57_006946 [Coemansia nantahalensis]
MHHQLLLSSLEFGTAATACATGAPQSMSARSSFTGRTLSNAPVGGAGSAWADHYGSDSDCSGSEASAMFPEHVAERSGSTLFSPLHASHSQLAAPPRAPADPPKPLPVPPRGARHQPGARKPAPIFEVGSARLTYGSPAQPPAAVCKAQGHRDRTGSLPLANDPPAAPRPPGDRWQTAFREPARGWPATGADASLRVDSTESFCIISPVSPQQGSDHHSRTRTLI